MSSNTQTRHQVLINQVAQYVYDHSDQAITLDDLADVVHVSKYHLNRVFAAATGCKLGEFVKRRRLEKAYRALEGGDCRVIDVAMQVGYESHASFSRAFQQHFSVAPMEVLEGKVHCNQRLAKTSGKVSEKASAKPLVSQELASIRCELPETAISGLSAKGFVDQSFEKVASQLFQTLVSNTSGVPFDALEPVGVSIENPWLVDDQEECRFFAGLKAGLEGASIPLETYVWPAGEWQRFIHVGPYTNIWQTIECIFNSWVLPNNIALGDTHIVQCYLNNPFETLPDKLETALYFPLSQCS